MANNDDRYPTRPVSPWEALIRFRIESFDSSKNESLSPKQRPFFQSLFILNRAAKGERFTRDEIATAIGGAGQPFLQRAIGRYATSQDSRTNLGARTLLGLIPNLSPTNAYKVIKNVFRTTGFSDFEGNRELTNHANVIKALASAQFFEARDFTPVLDHMLDASTPSSSSKKDPGPINDEYYEVVKDLIDKISLDQSTVDEFVERIDPNTHHGTELIEALADRGFLSPENLETIVRQSIFFDNADGLRSFIALQKYNASQSQDRQIDLVQVAKDIPDVALGTGGKRGYKAVDILVLQRVAGLISYDELAQRLGDPRVVVMFKDLVIGYAAKNIDAQVADELIANGFIGEKDDTFGPVVRSHDISNRPDRSMIVSTERGQQLPTDTSGQDFDR